MKIGIVCEGGLQGEDQKVLSALAARIVPAARFEFNPQGTKPELIANCGLVAKTLRQSGCCRVLIVWDVQPRWGKPDGARVDRQEIQRELAQHGMDSDPCVFLVPIEAELEAWLLADGAALSAVLSRPAHPARIANTANAHSVGNPKKRLQNLFQRHARAYVPATHATLIVNALARNFGALGGLPGFKAYGRALTESC